MYNQPYAGGWRFGDRPTSVEALYQAQQPNNDFLKKVAALAQDPEKKGLLDQALTAEPITGLLESPGSSGWGADGQQNGGGMTSGSTGIGTGSMSDARDSAALAAAGSGLMKGGGPGLLGIVNAARAGMKTVNDTNGDVLGAVNSTTDPIAALNAIQGWTTIDQAYMDAMRRGYVDVAPGQGYGESAGPSFGGAGAFGAGDYGDGTDR
jgi:hypothetical protein